MNSAFRNLYHGPLSLVVNAALVSTALLPMINCSFKKEPAAKSESISDIQKREGIPVRTVVAQRKTLTILETAGGTAEGYFQTRLTAGIPGTVSSVNVAIGDHVSADSSLMCIEPNTPQNYAIAKQTFENATRSRDRIHALAKEGGVSQEILDQVDAGYNSAREGLSIIRKNQFVIAPFSGTVTSIFTTKNSEVSPGTELLTIANINKIRIPVQVSDLKVNRFKNGQSASITMDGDSVWGTVDRVPLSGNAMTHTFEIDVVFDNSDHRIKPGMYFNVTVIVNQKTDILTLPIDCIITEGNQQSAFIIDKGIARRVSVSTGIRSSDLLEITDGITEGAQVVVSGAGLLSDGALAKVIP